MWDGEKKEGKRQKKDRRGWGQREEKTTVGAETKWMERREGEKQGRWMGEERGGRVKETGGKSDHSTTTDTKANSDLSATPAT